MVRFPHCGAFLILHNFEKLNNFQLFVYIFFLFFRSINSFNDDLALALPPGREFHSNNVPALLMTSSSIRANLSRSTDRNLDNLGLSDEDLLIDSNRTSGKRYFPWKLWILWEIKGHQNFGRKVNCKYLRARQQCLKLFIW